MKPSKPNLQQIKRFLEAKHMAVAGVSHNPKKFGYQVFKALKERGYDLFPLNPNTREIDGHQVYATISELPEEVKHLVILTPKTQTEKLVMEAIAHGIDQIWIQQMSDTPEAVTIATEAGVRLITGQCIFMWVEPVTGIHKFHRTFMKLFGLLPR
ncbi:MAG: CoA-binding protein [Bacteroidales bacterium]|nr:CoA-binding protein [Bacteroidales bacterium]